MYLNAREMVIEVLQGLQRQNANVVDPQLEEEIVLQLNLSQSELLTRSVTQLDPRIPRFEINQNHYSYVQSLIRNDQVLLEDIDALFMKGPLPVEHLFLLSEGTIATEVCKLTAAELAAPTEVTTFYRTEIPLVKSTKGNVTTEAKYYNNFKLAIDAQTVVDITKNTASTGLDSKELLYLLRDKCIQEINRTTEFKCYWENYRGTFKANTLIIIGSKSFNSTLSVEGTSKAYVPTTFNVTSYKTFPVTETLPIPNRLIRGDYKFDILGNKYYGSSMQSIASWIENSYYVIHVNSKRFIPKSVLFSYIRQPKRISLVLNDDCELHQSAHKIICDMAVSALKKKVQSPAYQVEMQERQINFQ